MSKPVSRQRQWQRRQYRNHRCIICGKGVCKRSRCYCERHRKAHLARANARYHRKREAS